MGQATRGEPPRFSFSQPIEGAVGGTPIQDYGDFAVAVGAAHEVGHHVQQQLGIFDARMTGEVLDIQTELQADCFAGVWGFSTYYEGLVESGDLDEAITILTNIGDVPEQPRGGPGAHGSPEERAEAFTLGYDSGDPAQCLAYTPPPAETSYKRGKNRSSALESAGGPGSEERGDGRQPRSRA